MKRRIIAVTSLAVLIALGCALRTAPARDDAPIRVGDGLVLGTPIRTGNLAVWPVIAEELPDIGSFRTLEEAQECGELAIHERDEAEVATLVIENRGDVPILACAGAVFAGGKQDRQLGEDIVVAPKTTVPVKTFCVEAGRWSGGNTFRVMDAKATRTVRAAGQYSGDQSGVWSNVDQARATMGLSNGSYRAVAEARQGPAGKVIAHLREHAGDVVGYTYAIHGRMMGMRTFAHPKLFRPRVEALVRAVCAESEQTVSTEELSELKRMTVYMRMASDAYDSNEYDLAQTHAEEVLALEPDNERAKELIRIAKESRYAADRDEIRKDFKDEWTTVMAQLETTMLASPRVLRYLRDTGVGVRGLGAGTNLDDSFVGASANPWGSPGAIIPEPSSIGTATDRTWPDQSFWDRISHLRAIRNDGGDGSDGDFRSRTENVFDYILDFDVEVAQDGVEVAQTAVVRPRVQYLGLVFTGGLELDIRGFVEQDITLVHAAKETLVQTKGVNRNTFKRTTNGNRSTCSIRAKDGRWIALTRDWTAR